MKKIEDVIQVLIDKTNEGKIHWNFIKVDLPNTKVDISNYHTCVDGNYLNVVVSNYDDGMTFIREYELYINGHHISAFKRDVCKLVETICDSNYVDDECLTNLWKSIEKL
jgi:hypothetical protein